MKLLFRIESPCDAVLMTMRSTFPTPEETWLATRRCSVCASWPGWRDIEFGASQYFVVSATRTKFARSPRQLLRFQRIPILRRCTGGGAFCKEGVLTIHDSGAKGNPHIPPKQLRSQRHVRPGCMLSARRNSRSPDLAMGGSIFRHATAQEHSFFTVHFYRSGYRLVEKHCVPIPRHRFVLAVSF